MLVGLLGGRAAEELVFDTVTTGASNDIEKATKIAKAMITQYGMSDKFGLMALATVEEQYLNGRAVLNCGDDTATEIDHEVMELLDRSYKEAKKLLSEHREALDKIAAYLIRHETITGKEFMKIFRAVEMGLEIPDDLKDLVLPDSEAAEEKKTGAPIEETKAGVSIEEMNAGASVKETDTDVSGAADDASSKEKSDVDVSAEETGSGAIAEQAGEGASEESDQL